MRKFILLSALSFGALVPYTAAAQVRTGPFVGVAVGAGSVPMALLRSCDTSPGTHRSTGSVELRAGLHLDRVAVESRTSFQDALSFAGDDCFSVTPVHDRGVHTDAVYPFEQGSITTTTVQLRARLPVPWLTVSAGGGWAWSQGLPLAVLGTEYRRGEQVRFGVDAELMLFRVPFDRVTREWDQARVVRAISTEREREWHAGLAVRFAVERGLRR